MSTIQPDDLGEHMSITGVFSELGRVPTIMRVRAG